VAWFIALRDTWAVKTWTDRRNYLKSCIQWAINEGEFTGKNPYLALKPRKDRMVDKVKPFTTDEIGRILHALDTNQFCPAASSFKHSHYSAFVRFLFLTACRLGEATGLGWDCIDSKARTIVIKQALGRDVAAGPNTTRKILKETKTGNVHYVPMNDALVNLLESIKPDKLVGFVFKGQRGAYIELTQHPLGVGCGSRFCIIWGLSTVTPIKRGTQL
jgi:integrase